MHNSYDSDIEDGHYCMREKAVLLGLAWKWCHELETTALMVELMHKTQQLWNKTFGDLSAMPDMLCAPPLSGYQVQDRSRCG
jgi:hypothetical protein